VIRQSKQLQPQRKAMPAQRAPLRRSLAPTLARAGSEAQNVQMQRLLGNRVVGEIMRRPLAPAEAAVLRRQPQGAAGSPAGTVAETPAAAVAASVQEHGAADAASSAAGASARSQVEVDAAVRARLEAFLTAFQNIPVRVRWEENGAKQEAVVQVHPPYFINSTASTASKNRFDKAAANRKAATGSEDKAPVATALVDRIGKTTPQNLAAILQSAVDHQKVPFPAAQKHPNAEDLRKWLVTYGIGVDCSGFVSQALNLVMGDLVGQGGGSAPASIALGSSGLKGGAKNFAEVARPKDLRPGDTMWREGHIRIVTSVSAGASEVQFTTAESTAAQSDIGPTSAQWRYPDPEQFSKLQKFVGAKWKNVTDEPGVFGRYSATAKAKAKEDGSQREDRKQQRVLQQNERFGAALGWQQKVDDIVAFFARCGYLPPDQTPDAAHFAAAVEAYQRSTPSLGADGILGPGTWRSLQAAMTGKEAGTPPAK